MRLTIEVELDNDQFAVAADDDGGVREDVAAADEVADVLERKVVRVLRGRDVVEVGEGGTFRDVNGNTVGRWRVR